MGKNVVFSMRESLTYTPTDWINDETPLNEDNMNNIEDGIVQLTKAINQLRDDNSLLDDNNSALSRRIESISILTDYLNNQINGKRLSNTQSIIRHTSGILHYVSEILYQIYGIDWEIIATFGAEGVVNGLESRFSYIDREAEEIARAEAEANGQTYTPTRSYVPLKDLINPVDMNQPDVSSPVVCTGSSSILRDGDRPNYNMVSEDSMLGRLNTAINRLDSLFNAYVNMSDGENPVAQWIGPNGEILSINDIFDRLLSQYLTREDIEEEINTLGELLQWASMHENSLVDLISNTNSNTINIIKLKTDFEIISNAYDEILQLKDSLSSIISVDKSWSDGSTVDPAITIRFRKLSDETGEITVRVNGYTVANSENDTTYVNEILLGNSPSKDFCLVEGSHTFPVKMSMTQGLAEITNVGYINISPAGSVNDSAIGDNVIINPAPISTINKSPSTSNAWMCFGYTSLGEEHLPAQLLAQLGGLGSTVSLEYYDHNLSDYKHIANAKVGVINTDNNPLYFVGKVCYKGTIYDTIDYSTINTDDNVALKGVLGLVFTSNRYGEDDYIDDIAKYCNYKIISGNGTYYIGPDKLATGTYMLDSSTKYGANLTDRIIDAYTGSAIPDYAYKVDNMNIGANSDQISVFYDYNHLLNGGPMINGWGTYYQLKVLSGQNNNHSNSNSVMYEIVDKRRDPARLGEVFNPTELNFIDDGQSGYIYMQIKNSVTYSDIYNLNIGNIFTFVNLNLTTDSLSNITNTYVYKGYSTGSIAGNRWFGFHRYVDTTDGFSVVQYNADEVDYGANSKMMVGTIVVDLNQSSPVSAISVNCLGPKYEWSIGRIRSIEAFVTDNLDEIDQLVEPDFLAVYDANDTSGALYIDSDSSKQVFIPVNNAEIRNGRYVKVRVISEPFGNGVYNPITGGAGLYFNWMMINEIEVFREHTSPLAMTYAITPDLTNYTLSGVNDCISTTEVFDSVTAGFIPQSLTKVSWFTEGGRQLAAIRDLNLSGRIPYGCEVAVTFDDGSSMAGYPRYYADLKNNIVIGYIGRCFLHHGSSLTGDPLSYATGENGENFAATFDGFMWNDFLNTEDTMLSYLEDRISENSQGVVDLPNVTACLVTANASTPGVSRYIRNIQARHNIFQEDSTNVKSTGFSLSKVNMGRVSLISNIPLNNVTINNIDTASIYCIKD